MLVCERLRSASKKDKPGLETRIFVTRNIFCIIKSAFINLSSKQEFNQFVVLKVSIHSASYIHFFSIHEKLMKMQIQQRI